MDDHGAASPGHRRGGHRRTGRSAGACSSPTARPTWARPTRSNWRGSRAPRRQRGIATSTFGVGADFDERTLQRLAEGGQGHFYFVETPQAIADLLTSELGDSLEIVAREAAPVLHVPEGVDAAPVGPFRVSSAGRVVRIELGDLASGQELQVAVKFTFPAGRAGDRQVVGFALAAKDDALGALSQEIAWEFAGHAENDAQRRDGVVDRADALRRIRAYDVAGGSR